MSIFTLYERLQYYILIQINLSMFYLYSKPDHWCLIAYLYVNTHSIVTIYPVFEFSGFFSGILILFCPTRKFGLPVVGDNSILITQGFQRMKYTNFEKKGETEN